MSLFSMNTGEIGIRGKSTGKFLCYFIIMFHTLGTCLFITSHDKTYSFVKLNTRIMQKLHGIQRFQNRTFIIRCTTTIYIITLAGQFKRIMCPVAAYRNNIQMSGDTYDFFAFSHFCISTVIIQVHSVEAKLLCYFKSFTESLGRSFTKGHSFCGSTKL